MQAHARLCWLVTKEDSPKDYANMHTERAKNYLRQKISSAKDDSLMDKWSHIAQMYKNKLWHQLTMHILDALKTGALGEIDMKELYDEFIRDFEQHMNPLQLSMISVIIAHNIHKRDPKAASDFLKARECHCGKDKAAMVRLHTAEIELKLLGRTSPSEVRKLLEQTHKELDDIGGVTPVHAPFFKVSALYMKETKNYAGYYREALRYLGCGTFDEMEMMAKKEQALLIGIAALLGEDIYNFGELLSHKIVDVMATTELRWLYEVLFSLNAGDVQKFNELEKSWGQWTDLKTNEKVIRDKVRLLSIVELSFSRNPKQRFLTFEMIARKAQVPMDKVELLVMRAMSKKLISGTINEPAKTVTITHVQPRVLNLDQVSALIDLFSVWEDQVIDMSAIVINNAKEIILTKAE
uniref:26S proteasome non-ATPase regulatory subunit 13 n=1 Tax=Steinernema glaseri TaxID=37863 RepID=A0A1I8ARU7_9BILA